jgi:hypothetical protein
MGPTSTAGWNLQPNFFINSNQFGVESTVQASLAKRVEPAFDNLFGKVFTSHSCGPSGTNPIHHRLTHYLMGNTEDAAQEWLNPLEGLDERGVVVHAYWTPFWRFALDALSSCDRLLVEP